MRPDRCHMWTICNYVTTSQNIFVKRRILTYISFPSVRVVLCVFYRTVELCSTLSTYPLVGGAGEGNTTCPSPASRRPGAPLAYAYLPYLNDAVTFLMSLKPRL